MHEFDARKMLSAAPAIAGSSVAIAHRARGLSAEAQKVAAEPIAPAYSPVVLAGVARIVEACLIAVIGVAIYFLYVYPVYGFAWYYLGANLAIAALTVIAFEIGRLYDIQAFRMPVSHFARFWLAWSVVFLVAMAIAFFAKFEGMFSRVWLAGNYGVGLVALIGFRLALSGLVRHWTREGRLDRRAVVVGGGAAGSAACCCAPRAGCRRGAPTASSASAGCGFRLRSAARR